MGSMEFTLAGLALYGANWKEPLRLELKVDERTFRRWRMNRGAIPDGVATQIRGLLEVRRADVDRLLVQIAAKPGAPTG